MSLDLTTGHLSAEQLAQYAPEVITVRSDRPRTKGNLRMFTQLSGQTRLFPIIGEPIQYVESQYLSPAPSQRAAECRLYSVAGTGRHARRRDGGPDRGVEC
jgi:hypothetical protein